MQLIYMRESERIMHSQIVLLLLGLINHLARHNILSKATLGT